MSLWCTLNVSELFHAFVTLLLDFVFCADLSFVLSVVTNKPLMATNENSRLAARWIVCSMLGEMRCWGRPDLYWLRPNVWSEFNIRYYVYGLVGGSLFL